MSLAQLLLLRQGGASGTLPLEETCEVGSILALSRLMPGHIAGGRDGWAVSWSGSSLCRRESLVIGRL